MDEAEDGGVRSDAESQSEDADDGEGWSADQGSEGMAEVAEEHDLRVDGWGWISVGTVRGDDWFRLMLYGSGFAAGGSDIG